MTDSTAPVPDGHRDVEHNDISSAGGGTPAPAICTPGDTFLTGYAANPGNGDSFINMVNDGASALGGATGNLCVNIYTFDSSEEMLSCCTCVITPNGLVSLSVNESLLSNTINGERPASAVVALVSTPGLHAWSTSLRGSALSGYGATEHALLSGLLSRPIESSNELLRIHSGQRERLRHVNGCSANGLGAVSKF